MSGRIELGKLEELVPQALKMTTERREKSPEDLIIEIIHKQLSDIQHQLETNIAPPMNQRLKANFDSLAVRQLEHDDPEYLDLLAKVGFLYRQWSPQGQSAFSLSSFFDYLVHIIRRIYATLFNTHK